MKRITMQQFLEMCEEYYVLVNDCGLSSGEAMKEITRYLKGLKVYGFREKLEKFGLETHEQLFKYGGQLAGDIEAF